MPPLTICVMSRKGGTGKTTNALNLAGSFVNDGLRVACLDLDGQGSLSRCLLGPARVESMHPANTTAGLFDPKYDPTPDDLIQPTRFDRLFVVPSSDALETFNRPSPAEAGEAQFVIRRFLDEAANRIDLAVIDTGPNTSGLLGWAALAASDFVLTPILPDPFGSHAIIHVQRLVEESQVKVNPKLRIAGYLLNMVQKNAVQQAYEQTLRQIHGGQVFTTVVPLLAPYREAIAERAPVTLLKPKVKASKVVKAVAEELEARITAAIGTTKKEVA